MRRKRRTIGLVGAATLVGAAGMHLYWLAGGRVGRARVIPTIAGRPTSAPARSPPPPYAAALTAAATLYAGAALGRGPRGVTRIGALGAASCPRCSRRRGPSSSRLPEGGARAGDFARLDTAVLSPLCAALAIAGVMAAA